MSEDLKKEPVKRYQAQEERKNYSITFACVVLLLFLQTIPVSASAVFQKARELPDAKDYILDALAQNKLVFVGEDHNIVSEELFMAENLQAFYDAGLRFLIREGAKEEEEKANNLPLPGSPLFRLMIFPPWYSVGGKYEAGLFSKALRKINDTVPEEERIRIIFPEDLEAGNDMNKRDQSAFRNISTFMEKLSADKKAIIFYGASHGLTKPMELQLAGGEPFLWKPLGTYLKEQYGDDFVSINFESAKNNWSDTSLDVPELRDSESKPKIVLPHSKNTLVHNAYIQSALSGYDAVILNREAVFGTGYNYAPHYENLFALYNGLRYLENSIDNWKDERALERWQEQGQYLQYIYYLKLWLDDKFDYRLWDTKKPLHEALDELGSAVFAGNSGISVSADTQRLYASFCKVMLMSAVEPLVFNNFDTSLSISETFLKEEVFPWIIDHMKECIALLPQDLWAHYWLAYAQTERGEYDKAIEEWEYIIAQPLAYCMETLPRVYQKLSKCYAAQGDYAKSDTYKKIGESLVNEHNLIVTNLNDVK
ncbi:MAG: hypothetical protein LBO67_06550 [Spirochaetaceae bacterium]|nr:hypothetical protein [Spirochaetaceae bacterium]